MRWIIPPGSIPLIARWKSSLSFLNLLVSSLVLSWTQYLAGKEKLFSNNIYIYGALAIIILQRHRKFYKKTENTELIINFIEKWFDLGILNCLFTSIRVRDHDLADFGIIIQSKDQCLRLITA